jgi:hypothetical protein
MMNNQGINRRDYLESLSRQKEWHDPELFQGVTQHLPPGITILQSPPGRVWQFNCYAYALGLHTHPKFFKTSTDGFIYSSFVKKIFEHGELVIADRPPAAGDIIFYKNGDLLKHAGVISNDLKLYPSGQPAHF